MLKIEIKTGGAAYRDENDELDRSAYELRRNLKEIKVILWVWVVVLFMVMDLIVIVMMKN